MAAPCNRCEILLPSWEAANSDAAECSFCGATSIVRVFPALFQPKTEAPAAAAAGEGEATCYEHPGKQAVAHCAQCGRFVCSTCSVEFRGEVWCPECFAAGARTKRTLELEPSRTLYDSTALLLATVPLLLWPFTFATAPATLFVVIRYWRAPLGLVRRSRWRMVVAALLALAQIVGWVWLVVYVVMKMPGMRVQS